VITLAAAALLALQPAPVVSEEEIRLSGDSVGLEWDCERDGGNDRLTLAERRTAAGLVPHFTRSLVNQQPVVIVDCPAEVVEYGANSLSMLGGFCPIYWTLEVRLEPGTADSATVDLQVGSANLRGYRCTRRSSANH